MSDTAPEIMAQTLVDQLREDIQATWRGILVTNRITVQTMLEDLSSLALRAVAGEQVEAEVALVRSTALDWAWVGAASIRAPLIKAAKKVAQRAADILIDVVSKLAWAALAGFVMEVMT